MTNPPPAEASVENDGTAYFLYHSIGHYPGKAAALAAAMAGFAAVWGGFDDAQWGDVLGRRQRYLDLWSALISAPPATLTTAENVTAALHMLVTALPSGILRGKRVLVAGDCFPSNHFLLTALAPRLGFTLDTVPIRQGEFWVRDEDVIERWQADVGLALITWVSSTSSHRADLGTMVAHGRAMGSLIGVDITQAAGLLPFSVADPAVDFAISTSLKWLCGTPGAGILQVAAPLTALCEPELRGWFSQDNPFSWALDAFAYAPDIRRFDNGTPSVMAAAASLPAMEWHAAQNSGGILGHNRALSARLLTGLDALGLSLASPRDPAERGGSLMVRLPAEIDPAALLAHLRGAGVFCDARGSTLRMSPGTMTTPNGTDRLVAALADSLPHRAP